MAVGGRCDPCEIVRRELRQFVRLAAAEGVDLDRQCRALGLSRDEWLCWLRCLNDAPLPPYPALPQLLRHIGWLASRLDRRVRMAYA